MSFIADDLERYRDQVVHNGHCVRYVQECAGAPHTSRWRQGRRVRGHTNVRFGTAIATFSPIGQYENRTDGGSHAAIFVEHHPSGIMVWDQWVGHPVAKRLIAYRGRQGRKVNDGDQFYVIEELDEALTAVA